MPFIQIGKYLLQDQVINASSEEIKAKLMNSSELATLMTTNTNNTISYILEYD